MQTHPALAPGRVAVITGAAGGIGLAAARRFASLGMKLCLADLSADALARAAAEIGAKDVLAVPTDVGKLESVQALKDKAYAAFGEVAVLMNNAGTAPGGGPWDHIDRWKRVLDVNLWGVIHGVQTFAPAMLAQGTAGAIVNTGSVAAVDGQIGQAAYSASKAGVVGMTLPIARDLSREGIRVNTILPGIFDTPLLGAAPQNVRDALAASVLNPKRLGNPTEYAGLALTMIENGYFNGEDVRLDGGIRMGPR